MFYLPDKEVRVRAPKSLINQLLIACNGERTTRRVIEAMRQEWDTGLVQKFLHDLSLAGAICDSTSISSHVWSFVKNPTHFARDLSDDEILLLVKKSHKRHQAGKNGTPLIARSSSLVNIIEQRRSTRVFSTEEVDQQTVVQMLWAGYGIVHSPLRVDDDNPQQIKVWQKHALARHTVPSAGALYPLRLSLGLLRTTGQYKAGVYDVRLRKPCRAELVMVHNDPFQLLRSFADHTVCNNAQGIIVVSCSFKISGEKYGNRSLLYVPLEAGHVAQNIHLSATEDNIGTVEIGGFLEEPLRQALRLPKDYRPITTVLFGYPADEELGYFKTRAHHEQEEIEVTWAPPTTGAYQLPFSMAFARPNDKKDEEWACGRAKDPFTALLKATSETQEWMACRRIPPDLVRARFNELDNAIDPRRIVRYHARQHIKSRFPLSPFDENQEYFWTSGQNVTTGEKVHILSDCIYFPYYPETLRYTMANSSGTAAHPQWDEAIKLATLELIERDAFMIVWLNRLVMPRIRFADLPQDMQKRIRALQRAGFRVVVKDFTLDLAPVAFVFAQNEILSMTTCAGCSSFEFLLALDHALMEVEAAAYCRLRSQPSSSIHPLMVRYTDDHGNLYEQRQFFHQADFLTTGGRGSTLKLTNVAPRAPKTWQELLERFEAMRFPVIAVDLSRTENQKQQSVLKIAKIFIPGTIPMSFGYGLEPLGMERIYTLPVRLGYRTTPMPYGKLTRFPHPYT